MKSKSNLVMLLVVCPLLHGAGEFKFVPIGASGAHTINSSNNEINLQGDNQLVVIEIRLGDWDPNLDGFAELGAWQATVDSTGYLGTNSTSPNGTDLTPHGYPDRRQLGAYQTTSVCFGGSLDGAGCGHPTEGPFITSTDCQAAEGVGCIANQEFVLGCCSPVAAVASANLNYVWGAVPGPASGNAGGVDNGSLRYGGTLELIVPTGARGTYTINFADHSDLTFMYNTDSADIGPPTLTPILITIDCGAVAQCNGPIGLVDFATLQNCFSGTAPTPVDCEAFDVEPDNDVDLDDLAALVSGANP